MRVEHWLYTVPLRLRSLFRRRQVEPELDEELQYHLEEKTQQHIAEGMNAEEARYAALRDMDGLERHKEECRDMRRMNFLDDLLKDVRFGLRQLRRNPGFTAVAVIILALGIGATTAIFSAVNGILLRPLPYPRPERLVSVREGIGNWVSYPNFFDWQAQNHVFSSMASYHHAEFTLTGVGEPLHVEAETVSAQLFGLLQVKPLIGRVFEPQDDQRGANVVILSQPLWRGRFHSDRSVVGRGVILGNKSFTVIGVMPAGFQFPPAGHTDLWTSVAVDRESRSNIMTRRDYNALSVIARLREGVSLARARFAGLSLLTCGSAVLRKLAGDAGGHLRFGLRVPGRTQNRDGFTVVPTIDPEVFLVDGNHSMTWEKLAQADHAQISQVGVSISVALR